MALVLYTYIFLALKNIYILEVITFFCVYIFVFFVDPAQRTWASSVGGHRGIDSDGEVLGHDPARLGLRGLWGGTFGELDTMIQQQYYYSRSTFIE